jgi:phosphoglycerate dehydrogenase-like enzyme
MPRPHSLLAVLAPSERDRFFPGALLDELRAVAPEFRLFDPTGRSAADFARELAATDPEVLLACWQSLPLPDQLPPRLRYLCYVTGSVRRLVTRGQIERGLLVTNWGGAISRMVAECALLHTLACLRRTTQWTLALHRDGGWRDGFDQVASLFQRRVGIHGFGSVAREFLRLIRPFDCAVSVCAPDVDDATARAHGIARAASLDALFAENDVIVELAPLTPATTGIVTVRHLRLIRPGGVFVNVGRGAVTDETALARIAAEGKISVGLDVFTEEPLRLDSPFRGLPNASLTPHIAGPTPDRYPDAGRFALRNLHAYAEGRPPEAVITPERYDATT